ncbi:hypothetical protein L2U69_01100 [Zavarzinia compransoris]|uniref:hypothetical protein n=1 Tax=Zavarzinia marina TaxID=2911065 RepID=UPI001F46DC57|nr:hypothetical protein [Zavarzinia marina]MCF4164240.1 hypothetical protein [Zavarzinia marina]
MRRIGWVAVIVLASGGARATELGGHAEGRMGDFQLRHAVAAVHTPATDPVSSISYIRVVMDDRPIPPWSAGAYSSLSALQADAVRARDPVVMLEIDVDNREEVYLYASYRDGDDRIRMTENTIPLESLAIGDRSISGSFFGLDDLISFTAPINAFPLTGAATGTEARRSAPYRAYLAFAEAMAAGDHPAVLDSLAPSATQLLHLMAGMDAATARSTGRALIALLPRLEPEVHFHDSRAVVLFRDPEDGEIPESLTLSLVLVDGDWKLEDR